MKLNKDLRNVLSLALIMAPPGILGFMIGALNSVFMGYFGAVVGLCAGIGIGLFFTILINAQCDLREEIQSLRGELKKEV